jgi:hydroxymethylbilane synthase
LNGGCQVPIAGFAQLQGEILFMRGLVGSPDGRLIYRAERTVDLGNAINFSQNMPFDDAQDKAEAIGKIIAEDLLAQGADKILQALLLE